MTVTRALCIVACAATVSGCAFQGVNSLPLPGAVGRGPHANIYHIEIANIGTLESNSPVMMADVVVGSVGKMRVKGDHADIEVSVKPDTVVPANAVAVVGQTSLLGSMHVELNPPLGQRPEGLEGTRLDRHLDLLADLAAAALRGQEELVAGPSQPHLGVLAEGQVSLFDLRPAALGPGYLLDQELALDLAHAGIVGGEENGRGWTLAANSPSVRP